jgi:hypothetical protein
MTHIISTCHTDLGTRVVANPLKIACRRYGPPENAANLLVEEKVIVGTFVRLGAGEDDTSGPSPQPQPSDQRPYEEQNDG